MQARQAAYIALKLLAIYLGLRAVERIVYTVTTIASLLRPNGDWTSWVEAAAPVIALLGALVLWLAAEPVAARVGAVRPLTTAELDAHLGYDDENSGVDHSTEDEEDLPPLGGGGEDALRARRAAYIALKLLAAYLAIQAISAIAYTVGNLRFPWDWGQWMRVGGSAVPLLGALVLWFVAEPLAARLGTTRPLTMAELEAYLEADDEDSGGDDTTTEDAGDLPAAETNRDQSVWSRSTVSFFVAALMVLGAFFIVESVQSSAMNAANLALHSRLSFFCGPESFSHLGPGQARIPSSCPFWDPQSTQSAVSLGSGFVVAGLGIALLRWPGRVFGALERFRRAVASLRITA